MPDCATPDSLIITDSFVRLNGSDGHYVARANLRTDGRWDVTTKPGEWTNMHREAAMHAMEAASMLYALGQL